MPDWTIEIQKTGERTSTPQLEKDGITPDGNKPISTGVITLTSPTGQVFKFDCTSGGYGNGELPGFSDPNNTSGYQINWNKSAFNIKNDLKPFQAKNSWYSYLEIIGDKSLVGDRDGFAIHPDGKYTADWRNPNAQSTGTYNDGTAGCVGIDAASAPQFFKILKDIPPNQRPQTFTVLPSTYGPDQRNKIKQEKTMSLTPKDKTYQIQAFLQLEGFPPNGIDGSMGKGCATAFHEYLNARGDKTSKLAKAVEELVVETKKQPANTRNQTVINKARDMMQEHVADRIKNDNTVKNKIVKSALDNVVNNDSNENKKIANAVAQVLAPDGVTINIEDDSNTARTVLQANLVVPQAKNNSIPIAKPQIAKPQTTPQPTKVTPQTPSNKEWYSEFGAKLGRMAQDYDNGYVNTLGATDKNPSFAEFVTDVINETILEERKKHKKAGLTSAFNKTAFLEKDGIVYGKNSRAKYHKENKKLIDVFDSATAFKPIDYRASSKLVGAITNNTIDIQVGHVLFLNKPGSGSKAENSKKNPVIVTKIDDINSGAFDALKTLDKKMYDAIKGATLNPDDLDRKAMTYLTGDFPDKASELKDNAYVHTVNNGVNFRIPLRHFIEGNVSALEDIGVHGIGDTHELVKKYKAFEEGTMMTDPTENNENLQQKVLETAKPGVKKTNTPLIMPNN